MVLLFFLASRNKDSEPEFPRIQVKVVGCTPALCDMEGISRQSFAIEFFIVTNYHLFDKSNTLTLVT